MLFACIIVIICSNLWKTQAMPESSSTPPSPPDTGDTAERQVSVQADRVSATTLLGERRLLRIAHNGEEYVLRITRNEKLILTK